LLPLISSVGPHDAHSLASRALLSLAYVYAAICAPAIILSPVFFKYWIGADFAAVAAPVAEILFFGAWINGLAFVPYGLLQSQGRPDVTGKFHAAEVLPFIGILWGLTSAYGITGAALAWNLRCAADAACLQSRYGSSQRGPLQSLVMPLCLLAGSYFVAMYVGPNLWVSLAAAGVAGLAGVTLAIVVCKDLRDSISALAMRVPGLSHIKS
jgi:O-antigen/teichoic acid export membrane protein